MHRLWSLVAELWLFLSQGDECHADEKLFNRNAMPRRGQPMPVKAVPLVPLPEQGDDASVLGILGKGHQLMARMHRARNKISNNT